MKKLLILLFLLTAVTACAPDPRKSAKAYEIRVQADIDSANARQQRAFQEQMNVIELQKLQLEQSTREATTATWQVGMNKMITVGFQVGTVAVSLMLLAIGVAFSYGTIGVGQAVARAAVVRANLIQMDRVTRQFPLFVQHVHGTRYALHNPNLGSVLMLDEKNPADRQLIATAGATQIAGVIGQEAAKSSDPAGLVMMQPPVVDVKDALIQIGGFRE